MNFCKDCKHWHASAFMPNRFCLHPDAVRDPETGHAFSNFERSIIGNCGEKGKLFEQREQRIGFFKRLLG
ncbi:hypothetical protein FSO04_24205 [Paraburkholderia madseniana]|uniref:Uncharacterized protein n=1 Tax=Paraburkholderia madseniana TaxID=2599607 RepID=A0A6N6W9I5_9BURK|nr:hypothetical protein [Paraburkholderia madseniana]KAE8757327.1 hypothetical protein FSO04_24205 [Paraburkholderia madseniana]